MSTKYVVQLSIKEVYYAETEEEALEQFTVELNSDNQTLETYIYENIEVLELCPNCEIPLEFKMIDVDGTNLEEHNVCPSCGYGTPALK